LINSRGDHFEIGLNLRDRNSILRPPDQREPAAEIVTENIRVAHQGFLHC